MPLRGSGHGPGKSTGTQTTADDAATQELIRGFLDAVGARDLERCLAYYADDATVHFMSGEFQGRDAVADWLKERFAAEVQFIRIDAIKRKGDTVTIDGVVTSKRLKAWKIGSLGGRATIKLAGEKLDQFKEVKFGLRMYNPLEGW